MLDPVTLVGNLWSFTSPPRWEHEKYTLESSYVLLFTILPLLLAAYIRLRHPGVSLYIRVILFCICVPVISHIFVKRYFAQVWFSTWDGVPLSINHLNFLIGMANSVVICKLIEVLFLSSEEELQVKGAKEYFEYIQQDGGGRELHEAKEKKQKQEKSLTFLQRPIIFPGSVVPLEIDIIMGIRGLGYNWGLKESKAGYKAIIESDKLAKSKDKRVASQLKSSTLWRLSKAAIVSLFLLDLCDSILKTPRIFPPAARVGGGSILEARGGVFGPAGPLIVTFTAGVLVFVTLQAFNSTVYFLLLLFTPASKSPITMSRWEPLPFNNPHLATSISTFWSVHWHSFIRRTFMVCAYRPTIYLSKTLHLPPKVGQALAILATFTLSGVLHEGCLQGQSNDFYDRDLHRRFNHTYIANATKQEQDRYGLGARNFLTTYSFSIQTVFVLLEEFWLHNVEPRIAHTPSRADIVHKKEKKKKNDDDDAKIITGPLRSLLGWAWTMSCVMYSGFYLCDLWLSHGLGSSICSFRLNSYLINAILNVL